MTTRRSFLTRAVAAIAGLVVLPKLSPVLSGEAKETPKPLPAVPEYRDEWAGVTSMQSANYTANYTIKSCATPTVFERGPDGRMRARVKTICQERIDGRQREWIEEDWFYPTTGSSFA